MPVTAMSCMHNLPYPLIQTRMLTLKFVVSIGWQGESWLWAVELIPLSIRGPANALATAANWLANFIVVLTCPIMFTNITWKTYVTYAVW